MDIIEHTRKVKTRKKHQCFACLRLFPKGAEMMVQVNNYDGQIGRVYSCLTCDEIMDKHKDVCYDEVDHVFREGCVWKYLNGVLKWMSVRNAMMVKILKKYWKY